MSEIILPTATKQNDIQTKVTDVQTKINDVQTKVTNIQSQFPIESGTDFLSGTPLLRFIPVALYANDVIGFDVQGAGILVSVTVGSSPPRLKYKADGVIHTLNDTVSASSTTLMIPFKQSLQILHRDLNSVATHYSCYLIIF